MLEQEYYESSRRKYLMIGAGALLTLIAAYVFTTLGMKEAGLLQTADALSRYLDGSLEAGADASMNKIILLLRLPRVVLAMIAGAGLAVAGALMQSVTRNALVSPFTLGISAAAALGASLSIVLGAGTALDSNLGIISAAFLLSCLCGVIVYGIAQRAGLNPTSIVLVGIALNYFFSALTATLEFFAQEHKLAAVIQWTFGSLHRASWEYVGIGGIIVAAGLFVALFYALPLNVMAVSDDETARSLGVNPVRLRTIAGLVAVFMTAAIISFTGVIGFVGLIAPHMARFLIGTDARFYLPFTAVLGAALLLVSDTVGKLILYPVTIPVGIVISFFGVPLFIHLILRNRREL